MSCYNTERRAEELRRCGCQQCEREYYDLRDRQRYSQREYYRAKLSSNLLREIPPMLAIGMVNPSPPTIATTSKETKVEEPKNIAIKLLVDKLCVEQKQLAITDASLKTFETQTKAYREAKNKTLKSIKELADALRKLGHKG